MGGDRCEEWICEWGGPPSGTCRMSSLVVTTGLDGEKAAEERE